MTENERFEQLWGAFKTQVAKARGDREAIYTMNENALTQRDGARVMVGTPTTDLDGSHYVNIHTSTVGASILASANAEDLIAIAAQCIAAAEEVRAEDGKAVAA